MGWAASIFIALCTGLTGAVLAGFVAALAVDWYRITSFEGASGYFMGAMILLGFAGGLLLGLVTSRVVAAWLDAGFFKTFAVAEGLTVGVVVLVGVVARLMADVPPRLSGNTLLLDVEISWPEAQRPLPAAGGPEWRLRLGSLSGRTLRASETGPLRREEARLENGRWVVPGTVEIFTSRGKRILGVEPDGVLDHGFLLPLPAFPGRTEMDWSEWLPRARPGDPPLPDGPRYRFRVVPESEPGG
jgi:MFS family permease